MHVYRDSRFSHCSVFPVIFVESYLTVYIPAQNRRTLHVAGPACAIDFTHGLEHCFPSGMLCNWSNILHFNSVNAPKGLFPTPTLRVMQENASEKNVVGSIIYWVQITIGIHFEFIDLAITRSTRRLSGYCRARKRKA